jgi:hypothetical protein
MDYRIVILQRGWVMVGEYHADGDARWLENAKVIRRWGTTQGLGQLINGPLPETVLDPAGRVDFHVLGVVATIKCDAVAWGVSCPRV